MSPTPFSFFPSHEDTVKLRQLVHSLSPTPDEEWVWLEQQLEWREFETGDALFRLNGTDAGIHCVRRGLVRYYYLTEDGRERNHAFAAEGNLVGCLPVIAGSGPCNFTVEALEPTRTVFIPSPAVHEFDTRHECWNRFKLRLMEHVALRKAAREAELLTESAEERYRRFITQFGALAERLPQFHIASYLGITPVALSRIRRRINPG
jgi:CRP-like cAMP-binding protein